MRVVNDTGLVLGWMVGSVPPHRLCATFLVKGTFELGTGPVAARSAEQVGLEGDVPEAEGSQAIRYASDFAPFKPRADLLLTGTAQAPGGKPAMAVQVGFRVGSLSRTLMVVGERRVTHGLLAMAPAQPEPFTALPLSWSRSYGGADLPDNPAGRGREDTVSSAGQKVRWMPNVVRREDLSALPAATLKPVGFGPIAPGWPQRMAKARRATYDARWLKETWPAPPRDFDWSYFNAAPEEQQLPGYLRGDETVRLENFQPDGKVLECRLPGLRPRWFIDEVIDGREQWREVPLVLDSLHVEADAPRLLLVWRGVGALRTNTMREIRHHFVIQESLADAALPAEHYRALLPLRLQQIDEAAATPAPAMPDIPPLEMQEIPFDWAAWEKDFAADVEQARKLIEQDPEAVAATPPMDYGKAHEAFGLGRALPEPVPDNDPAALASRMEELLAKIREMSPSQASALGPAPSAADLDAASAIAEIEKEFAEPEGKPESPAAEAPEWSRERCSAHAAARGDFSGQDLAGLDLLDLDFHGLSFRDAILKEANLAGCNLEGADFTQAVLAGADLSRARLRSAVLAAADLAGALLNEADLGGAVLAGADLSGAQLTGARLGEADATAALFSGSQLRGASLKGLKAPRADFTGAVLPGVDLSGAVLAGASAYQADASGADFSQADLTNFRAGEGADFSRARLKGVRAAGSVWESALLEEADFTEALLEEASFAEARMSSATLFRADLRRARLPRADLRRARIVQANLFRALLEGASLQEADLRGSNLYEAEFLNARVDGADLRLANRKGTKLA